MGVNSLLKFKIFCDFCQNLIKVFKLDYKIFKAVIFLRMEIWFHDLLPVIIRFLMSLSNLLRELWFSVPGGSNRRRAGRLGEAGTEAEEPAETQGALLPGAGVRAGAALQAAALSVRS